MSERGSAEGRRREAIDPRALGKSGWKDTLGRVRGEIRRDNLTMVAGGVAFYAFFALFPALAAIVAIYGLVADPQEVQQQVQALGGAVPAGVRDIVQQQLDRVASGSRAALGWGLVASLLITLWSANKGMKGLVDALDIVYDAKDERGFLKKNGLTLLLTLGAIVAAVAVIALVVAIPPVLNALGLGGGGRVLVQVLRWVLLAGLLLFGLSVLYRFGPHRHQPKWRWVSPGAVAAVLLFILASVAFSIYVASFGSYGKVFGSLAAVAILLMWMYIGAFAVLLGGELNAEAERQTRRHTTPDRPEPMGERGPHAAGEAPG